MSSDKPAIVIDNGSSTIKAGFAGDDLPIHVFPSVVGKTKKEFRTINLQDDHVGDFVMDKKGFFTLKYPIQRGIINDWDDMEKIWHYTFQELSVDPMEQPVLLTEPLMNSKAHREKMTQIMFETFGVPSMFVASQVFMSLVGSDRTTGVVLDSGSGVTNVVPFIELNMCKHAIFRMNLAGDDLTDYLMLLLRENHSFIDSYSYKREFKEIKKLYGYIALDFEEEMNKIDEKYFELPDGKTITVGSERFRCTEPLFQPDLIGHDGDGIHNMINSSIEKCSIEKRKGLYANIILSGGNTLFDGIHDRLIKELNQLVPSATNVKVRLSPNYSAWIGGSIIAFSSIEMISKEEYEEKGLGIVHEKCIY